MANTAQIPPLPDDILSAPVRNFLAATAAKTPTPGGGAVTALAGALAAALAQMALQYTLGKKKYVAFQSELTAAVAQLQRAAELLADLLDEDIAAYAQLSVFLKMPIEARIADPAYVPAVVAAISIPESVGGLALRILELCRDLRAKSNPLLLSDLAIAATLAHATVHASEFNVLVNLGLLPEKAAADRLRKEMHALSDKADGIYSALRTFILGAL